MDEDDDDLYGTSGTTQSAQNLITQQATSHSNRAPHVKEEELEDGEEEGEEIEEDSDSVISLILNVPCVVLSLLGNRYHYGTETECQRVCKRVSFIWSMFYRSF